VKLTKSQSSSIRKCKDLLDISTGEIAVADVCTFETLSPKPKLRGTLPFTRLYVDQHDESVWMELKGRLWEALQQLLHTAQKCLGSHSQHISGITRSIHDVCIATDETEWIPSLLLCNLMSEKSCRQDTVLARVCRQHGR
jgi:hypothetical protein